MVVPNETELTKWAQTSGISSDYKALCRSEQASAWVLQQLTTVGKAGKLKGFEMIKAVFLEPSPFTVENDLITPSFKLRRPQLQKR